MSSPLPPQRPSVYVDRRRRLSERLGGAPVLVVAGRSRPRNYAANTHRFRADSHFLYLVGAHLADAALLGRGGRWELFMTPKADDDALWHGETPSDAEVQEALGVAGIRPLSELAAAIDELGGGAAIGTIPAVGFSTRVRQAALLGRPWGLHDPADAGPAPLCEVDAALAEAMIQLRMVHDAGALELLRTASEGTYDAHLAGMAATRPGITEQQVLAAIDGAMALRGMEPSYNSIVSVHGEVLHNTTYFNTLAEGDLLLCDAGAEHQGWASDVTRTWPVSGRFSATQRDLYDIVLAAQEAAIAAVRPGVRYRELHLLSSRILAQGLVDVGILRGDPDSLVERGAHALFFPHGLGHLLGLDVHDMEDLGDRAGYASGRARSEQFGLCYLRLDRDLQAGMLVTIEPGIYLVPGILADEALCGPFDRDKTLNRERLAEFADVRGIRIEDDVLCTEGAPEVLTAAIPKDSRAVEAAVAAGR